MMLLKIDVKNIILNRVIARQEGQLKWLPETYTDLIEPKKIEFISN